MKKYQILISFLFVLTLVTLFGFAGHKLGPTLNFSKPIEPDTTTSNPKIDIKVKKEYDKAGNIVRYDSSYIYIYKYPDGSTKSLNIDSIFNHFQPYFFDKSFNLMRKPFYQFFEMDTIFQKHFFDQDYFMKQFEQEMFQFEKMMHEMDSLKNLYLKEMYPNIKQNNNPDEERTNQLIEI